MKLRSLTPGEGWKPITNPYGQVVGYEHRKGVRVSNSSPYSCFVVVKIGCEKPFVVQCYTDLYKACHKRNPSHRRAAMAVGAHFASFLEAQHNAELPDANSGERIVGKGGAV